MNFKKIKTISSQGILYDIRKAWWLAFAIILSVIIWGNYIYEVIIYTRISMIESLNSSIAIIGVFSIWGLGLRKKIFIQSFWRFLFFSDFAVYILYCFCEQPEYDLPISICIIFWLIFVCYYMGLFLYAFFSKQIWGIKTEIATDNEIYSTTNQLTKKKNGRTFIKLAMGTSILIVILSCIPIIINNNRVIYKFGNSPEAYKQMLEYRRKTIPEIQEYEKLFNHYLCVISIDSYDSEEEANWEFEAGFYNRYVFRMNIDIVFGQIDSGTGKVIKKGSNKEPKFSIWEVTSVSTPYALFHPRYAHSSMTQIKTFDIAGWEKLVEANGDLSVLGVELEKDVPVPNFEMAFLNND